MKEQRPKKLPSAMDSQELAEKLFVLLDLPNKVSASLSFLI